MNYLKKLLVLPVLLILTLALAGQDIPERPSPPRLVNDYANILSPDQITILERKLVSFNDSTSTQIVLVIVKSLNGYDRNDFAQRLGQKWGVGQKGKNNGIVILVKPKYPNEKGDAAIQTGYGLEGVLPDITCKQIVDNEMIPKFAQGDYYGGISAGIGIVISITKGEFTAGQYSKRAKQKPYGILVPIIILMVIVFWIRMNRGGTHSVGKSLPFWTSLFLLSQMGRGGSGSWGNFQSGGGSFGGGGGGGFGGFGGGSFGGGGAGGSW